jgi:hypothetical protein
MLRLLNLVVEPEDVDQRDKQEHHFQAEPDVVVVHHRIPADERDHAGHDHHREGDHRDRQNLLVQRRQGNIAERHPQHPQVDQPDRPGEEHDRQHVRALDDVPHEQRLVQLVRPGEAILGKAPEVLPYPVDEIV